MLLLLRVVLLLLLLMLRCSVPAVPTLMSSWNVGIRQALPVACRMAHPAAKVLLLRRVHWRRAEALILLFKLGRRW